jgi:hypothetical protein
MKNFLLLTLVGLLAVGAFTSCEEEQEPTKAIELTGGQTTQSVFADQRQASGKVSFTTTGAWTSTISEGTRATSWVTVTPSSGNAAGDYTITISLVPNYTGVDHTATVTITSGGEELNITVIQKATTQSGEVPVITNLLSPEYIPDPAFLEYCTSMMSTWDTDDDGKLSLEEAAAVNAINVPGPWLVIADSTRSFEEDRTITSLAGVEYFTGLKELNCASNKITSLDVSKNTALTSLNCQINDLTSLDVSKNTALTVLECGHNELTSLDISGCTSLTQLDCDHNDLTSLDVSKNTALTRLWIYDNPGDGVSKFPVTAWFDNNSVPTGAGYVFITEGWGPNFIPYPYDGEYVTITPDYQKAL